MRVAAVVLKLEGFPTFPYTIDSLRYFDEIVVIEPKQRLDQPMMDRLMYQSYYQTSADGVLFIRQNQLVNPNIYFRVKELLERPTVSKSVAVLAPVLRVVGRDMVATPYRYRHVATTPFVEWRDGRAVAMDHLISKAPIVEFERDRSYDKTAPLSSLKSIDLEMLPDPEVMDECYSMLWRDDVAP